VLTGGKIWFGRRNELPAPAALAVSGERIAAVGSEAQIRGLIGPATRVVNLKGALLLPGFIDCHVHLMWGGFQLLRLDLRDSATPAEFVRRIAARAASLPKGAWILGGSWDNENWRPDAFPDRRLIDPATPDHPVFLTRTDTHIGVANSLALARAGITRETPDPPGGIIVRDPETGEPTGLLKDKAIDLLLAAVPAPGPAEQDAAMAAALGYLAANGVTSIHDVSGPEDWEVFARGHSQGSLTARIYARTPLALGRPREASGPAPASAWLRFGGFKAFVDGSLGAGTALFFDSYDDLPGNAGLLSSDMFPEGRMEQLIAEADRAGIQVSVHAIGDKANATLLDIFERVAAQNGPRDRRLRIEHAQHLRPEDIPRMARLKAIASVQPYHLADDGRWAERRLGKERCRWAYPFRSLSDAGVLLAFGTDWPVAPIDPLAGIAAAVTRCPVDGSRPGGWIPQERLSIADAVWFYTGAGAFAEFAEQEKGRLEAGMLADIAVLSDDIFTLSPKELRHVRIECTIAGGKMVYVSPTVTFTA